MEDAVAEEGNIVKARRLSRKERKAAKRDPDAGFDLEPVGGGRVRRIEFDEPEESFEEEEPEPVAAERRFVPRHRATLQDIEAEIDNLHARKSRIARRAATAVQERQSLDPDDIIGTRVYSTETGGVTRAYAPDTDGGKRPVIYLEGSAPGASRRFHSSMVDKIIEGVDLEEETVVEETVTEYVEVEDDAIVEAAAPVVPAVPPAKPAVKKAAKKPAKKAAAATKAAAKSTSKTAPTTKTAAKPAADDKSYQPQCAALTSDGKQCRNSSRKSSKYCGSHKGYRPPTSGKVVAKKRTEPAVTKATDTAPKAQGAKQAQAKAGSEEHQPQCAALAASGAQCRNSSRKGSKYCASHKGYRPISKAKLQEQHRTKPRHAGAKDTKPSLRKAPAKKAAGKK